jgi:hypothetical protein
MQAPALAGYKYIKFLNHRKHAVGGLLMNVTRPTLWVGGPDFIGTRRECGELHDRSSVAERRARSDAPYRNQDTTGHFP